MLLRGRTSLCPQHLLLTCAFPLCGFEKLTKTPPPEVFKACTFVGILTVVGFTSSAMSKGGRSSSSAAAPGLAVWVWAWFNFWPPPPLLSGKGRGTNQHLATWVWPMTPWHDTTLTDWQKNCRLSNPQNWKAKLQNQRTNNQNTFYHNISHEPGANSPSRNPMAMAKRSAQPGPSYDAKTTHTQTH